MNHVSIREDKRECAFTEQTDHSFEFTHVQHFKVKTKKIYDGRVSEWRGYSQQPVKVAEVGLPVIHSQNIS